MENGNFNLLYYCGFCRFCYPFSTQEEGNKKEKGRKDEKRKEETVAGEKEEERYIEKKSESDHAKKFFIHF